VALLPMHSVELFKVNPYAAAIAKAVGTEPQGNGAAPVIPGRVLHVDGDGLCYYCAGRDGSTPGSARSQLIDKVNSARRAVRAEHVNILMTASGSHKGHRYAVARVKPYQGQRANSRRPENWGFLRDVLGADSSPFPTEFTATAEADDLFGKYAWANHADTVIYTQDKDMRMLPGLHLDWVDHGQHVVHPGVDVRFNGQQFGVKWFWLQMLQGDTADNIPGLPKYMHNDKPKLIGPKTAALMLSGDSPHHEVVAELYKGYYDKRWLVEMMEQAVLLWMRRDPDKWDCVTNPGNPLSVFNDGEHEFAKAYLEIKGRVDDANAFNAAAVEGI
jgi:hypothetical protein